MTVLTGILISAIGSLVAGGLGVAAGYFYRERRFRKVVNEAPKQYVDKLGELIKRAEREGPSKAIVNARAIVSARDSVRRHMIGAAQLLNSDIDYLARIVGEGQEFYIDHGQVSRVSSRGQRFIPDKEEAEKQAYDTIEVLCRKWPTIRIQVEFEIRKMISELGLNEA